MKNKAIIITIVVAIVTAGVGFFGGMQYQKSQRSNFGANGAGFMMGQRGTSGGRFGSGNGGAVVGQIISIDTNSITVKLRDGSSKIVILSGTTTINKQATGTKSDLTTGTSVAVFGQANSDGSVTAQSVQLNPVSRTASPTPSK